MMSVENFHERQIVVLLVREGDDEQDVLVLVKLLADRGGQVGLKSWLDYETTVCIGDNRY